MGHFFKMTDLRITNEIMSLCPILELEACNSSFIDSSGFHKDMELDGLSSHYRRPTVASCNTHVISSFIVFSRLFSCRVNYKGAWSSAMQMRIYHPAPNHISLLLFSSRKMSSRLEVSTWMFSSSWLCTQSELFERGTALNWTGQLELLSVESPQERNRGGFWVQESSKHAQVTACWRRNCVC